MDWAAHLEHLQTILREFNANMIILKLVLIWFFRNSLKPSISAQANKNDCQKDIWDQTIKKAITAEAKTASNLLSLI